VAQSALEDALGYALERVQFGEPIANFPRVADKIAMMAVEIMIARQKDSARRRDLEAGMANLSSVFASATEPRGRRRFHR
jgi:(2S)-methylsuccinyl-CoA dehydrogenase